MQELNERSLEAFEVEPAFGRVPKATVEHAPSMPLDMQVSVHRLSPLPEPSPSVRLATGWFRSDRLWFILRQATGNPRARFVRKGKSLQATVLHQLLDSSG